MNKAKTLFVVALFLGLTSLSLFAQYDTSPSLTKIVPSVIWAPASGGGTWSTEVQIYAAEAGLEVLCSFYYDGGKRSVLLIWTSSGAGDCFRTTNILSTLAGLDPSFDYFGRSGALWITDYSVEDIPIQVMARTYHSGGYAKSICGLSDTESNTATIGRQMMIMNVMQSSSFRTSVTLFNVGAYCAVNFIIIQNGSVIGYFTKYLENSGYKAFNVFAEAGLTGTYTNCWVKVWPSTGGTVFCSGATAHNSTNDPAYHVAMQYEHTY